jgi:hypothetical protein
MIINEDEYGESALNLTISIRTQHALASFSGKMDSGLPAPRSCGPVLSDPTPSWMAGSGSFICTQDHSPTEHSSDTRNNAAEIPGNMRRPRSTGFRKNISIPACTKTSQDAAEGWLSL